MTDSTNPKILDQQYPKVIDTKKLGPAAICLPMAYAGTDSDHDTAIRCRVLVEMYAEGNSRVFAEECLRIGYTRWNNIERTGAVSRDVARILTRKYPEISLDWLLRGRDDGLSSTRSRELLKAFKKVAAERASVPAPSERVVG